MNINKQDEKFNHLKNDVYDTCIVGAGPTGLWALAQAKLLGLKAILVEGLDHVGGQCYYLYPEKKIYDIPGCYEITGKALTDNLLKQTENEKIIVNQEVQDIVDFNSVQNNQNNINNNEKKFIIKTQDHNIIAKSVMLSSGYGGFHHKKLKVNEKLENKYENTHLLYKVTNKSQFIDKNVVIVGGGDSALDWANEIADIAKNVTLVHRKENFRGMQGTLAKVKKKAYVLTPYEIKDIFETNDVITHVTLKCSGHQDSNNCNFTNKATENPQIIQLSNKAIFNENDDKNLVNTDMQLKTDYLLCFLGIQPKFKHWNVEYINKKMKVNPATYETSKDMIFAVGAASHIGEKKNLILTGFDEATQALYLIQERLYPEKKINYFSK